MKKGRRVFPILDQLKFVGFPSKLKYWNVPTKKKKIALSVDFSIVPNAIDEWGGRQVVLGQFA